MNGRRGTNTALAVSVAVLTVILIVVAAVYFLLTAGVISIGVNNGDQDGGNEIGPDNGQEIVQNETTNPDNAVEAISEPATDDEIEPMTMYVANVQNSVYFRSAPAEESSNIITTIPVGTRVTFLKNEGAIFAEISYDGMTGYVKREYLSTKKPSHTPGSGNTAVQKYVYVANVKNSIYLRSSAAENSGNIITTIPVGTQVGFIERTNSTFSKIKYNGSIGYAKSAYLEDYYYEPAVEYMTVYNVKNSIYLRREPVEDPNNIICTIPVNSTVRFINTGNGTFYKISWGGYTGYAKSKFLR